MIRKPLLIPTAALCLLVLAAPMVRADAVSDARKAIQAAYNKMGDGFARKDASGAMASFSPDFVGTSKDGQKVTAAQLRQMLPNVFASVRSLKAATTIQKFALKGGTATVTARGRTEMSLVNPQTQQIVKVVGQEVSQDVWSKGAGGWRLKSSKTTSSSQTVNGKPVPSR